ncbi:hypothetical protein V6C07_11665, partial [Desulfovibrio sp. 1214_IL3152]
SHHGIKDTRTVNMQRQIALAGKFPCFFQVFTRQHFAVVGVFHPSLEGLVNARLLGRRTLRRIHFNFVSTLALNSAFLVGGLFMIIGPGVSALLHNVTTLGVALNAMRPHLPKKALPGEESHFEHPASS